MGLSISTGKLPTSLTLFLAMVVVSACAHKPSFNPSQEASDGPPPMADSKAPPVDPTKEQITKLQDRVADLETRLSALNDKINLENGGPAATSNPANATLQTVNAKSVLPETGARPTGIQTTNLPTQNVVVPPAHAKVIPAKPVARKSSKQGTAGFSSNESVDRFREAKILFDAKKYSDAVLEFSDFVKNEPEHPLAPAAQYFLAMSYLNENEYKLAEEEFSRGLLSYPHSSYIPDTLLALADVSGKLKKPTKVTYYKEKILSNFPNSPQAKAMNLSAPQTAPLPEGKHEAKANVQPSKTAEGSPQFEAEMSGEATVVEKPSAPQTPTLKMESAKEGIE